MMVDMMSGKPVTQVPFAQQYPAWMALKTPADIAAIKNELNTMINGTEIQTSSWMPVNRAMQLPERLGIRLQKDDARITRHVSDGRHERER